MIRLTALAGALAAVLVCAASAFGATPVFRNTKVLGPPNGWSWNEPRITQSPDGKLWVSSIGEDSGAPAGTGSFNLWSSSDGGRSFKEAPAIPPNQGLPSPDTDVVAMPSGRVIGSELDQGTGVNFPTWYTDDGGKTWTQSQGSTMLADQDRQWYAVGPDPQTHKSNVYLLYHNLASGNAQHNMFVARSTDGGATFGPPVPITLPGSDAYTDLQCADSGGPSAIWVNQRDGTVYAEFTTRASPTPFGFDAGGCAAPAFGQPIEFNIVAGTRVWVAQSNDAGQTWSNSLAVDDSSTGQIVSMQVAYGGLDSAGNVYVAYPETPNGVQYPDYSGAGVRYKFAAPAKDGNFNWSAPRTFTPAIKGTPGHVLVHVAIGDPGQLEGFYWTGVPRPSEDPAWFMTAAETLDGMSARPHVSETRISDVPTDIGTASILMGACTDEGPITGVVNGVDCDRSPDVWGVTLMQNCMPAITWPAVDQKDKVTGNNPGTWVSTQVGGGSLCGPHPGAKTIASPGACPDRIPPVSKFRSRRVRRSRHGYVFRGTSRDKGCRSANMAVVAGKVAHVYVSIAKVRGKGRGRNCRFLTSKGRLTHYRRCRKPVLLRARGTTHWRLTVRGRLPRGHYRVVVRGVDRARNKERPHKGRNIAYFRVR